jgi:putative effector of murein hydrolase LrgA (UPF0299 family)
MMDNSAFYIIGLIIFGTMLFFCVYGVIANNMMGKCAKKNNVYQCKLIAIPARDEEIK